MFSVVFFEPQASLKVSVPREQIESGVTGHSVDSVFRIADAGSAIFFRRRSPPLTLIWKYFDLKPEQSVVGAKLDVLLSRTSPEQGVTPLPRRSSKS